jgi:hypothetical protein
MATKSALKIESVLKQRWLRGMNSTFLWNQKDIKIQDLTNVKLASSKTFSIDFQGKLLILLSEPIVYVLENNFPLI